MTLTTLSIVSYEYRAPFVGEVLGNNREQASVLLFEGRWTTNLLFEYGEVKFLRSISSWNLVDSVSHFLIVVSQVSTLGISGTGRIVC